MADDKTDKLIAAGTEIAGGAVGGALGFFAGGPVAAGGAAALGVAVAKGAKELITDLANRQLSRREQVKVGAAAAIAVSKIKDYLDKGETPRDDGFFDAGQTGRSPSDEVFEGVLLKSKSEHEERKIPHLGAFYANLAFSPGVAAQEANHFLRLLESLSYRQLLAISFIRLKDDFPGIKLRESDFRSPEVKITYETATLLQDVLELNRHGLVLCSAGAPHTNLALNALSSIVPARLYLSPTGERLFELADLAECPRADLEHLGIQLAADEATPPA